MTDKPTGSLYAIARHNANEEPLLMLSIGNTGDVAFNEWLALSNLFNDKVFNEGTFLILLQFWLLLRAACPNIVPMPYLADKLLPCIDENVRIYFFSEQELKA